MGDGFRDTARNVSTLQSVVTHWKKTNDNGKSSLNKPETSLNKPKNVLKSFKTVVDRVKLLRRFIPTEAKVFKSVFNLPNDNTRRLTILDEGIDGETEDESLRNLPEMSDAEVVNFTSSKLAGRVINSTYFRFTILFLIIVNSVLIAVETDKYMEREYRHVFNLMDRMIMTVFICEILLKWYHSFTGFWTQGWNVLDFLIVASLIIGSLLMSNTSGERGVLRILRVLRAFRSLRSISSLPGLQVVVQTILHSVPDMTNIVLLLVIIMLVFSVVGITLFREVLPGQFGDMSTAMFSLFICVTQDGWMDIFEAFQRAGEVYYYGGGLFLVLFIAIGAFIFANLVVAVVVTNLECAVKEVKKEEEQQVIKGKNEDEYNEGEVQITHEEEIPNKVFQEQTPLITPNLAEVDVGAIENYFLVLSAMEENLNVYQALKKDLVRFYEEICILNKSAIEEGVIDDESTKKKATKGKEKEALESLQKAVAAGDIVSNLMNLEGSNLINTRTKNTLHEVLTDSATVHSRLGSLSSSSNIPMRRNRAVMGRHQKSIEIRQRSSLGF